LTVEAIAANPGGRLKPGLFATAAIQQPVGPAALLAPASAVETVSGTSRVYVVKNGKIEERIVTVGDRVNDRIEITSGVQKGDVIAAEPRGRLADGLAVRAR
jgi:multidrug efflux pump subunit AcrA (membrane-fusion protein)